jgi:hypothetical protein
VTHAEITKLFARVVEQKAFERWSRNGPSDWRCVFAHEYGAIWKFTLPEWWRFVASVVRQNGTYDLPFSKALSRRPKELRNDEHGKYQSADVTARCVNLRAWSLSDWQRELGEAGIHGARLETRRL